jgi:hypothetical protein
MFHSDNAATINKMSCKDKIIMTLERRLVLATLKHNILFKACHVPGKINFVADYLSRFRFQEAFQCLPTLSQTPVKLPQTLLVI